MIIGKSLTALGSGGLKPEIHVTAKAGALLNLHYKGSSIILQSYQLGASETTHTFVVSVSDTAYVAEDVTNGVSVEVLVDAVSIFEVKIKYYPDGALYWLGEPCEDVTGGWTENFRFSSWTTNELRPVEFLDDCIKCDTSKYSGAGGYTIVGTYNKINFSGYTKLHTEIDVISTSKGKDWPSFVGSIVAENPFNAGSNGFDALGSGLTETGVMTYEADITSYTNERYVVILLNSISQSGRSANVDIKKVWLE